MHLHAPLIRAVLWTAQTYLWRVNRLVQVTIEALEGAVTFVNGRRISEPTVLKQVRPRRRSCAECACVTISMLVAHLVWMLYQPSLNVYVYVYVYACGSAR